jgi:hypothetical protein
MTMPARLYSLSLLILLGVYIAVPLTASAQAPTPPPGQPASPRNVFDPKALAILKATGDRLSSAQSLRFTAIATYESPSLLGPALAYSTRSEVTLQRPNRLQVLTLGDGPATEFYYDGKIMAAYAPTANLVAIAEAPATLDEALRKAYRVADIYFPFSDVIVSDPYQDMVAGLKTAFVVGQSNIVGGTKTNIVAIVNDQVFAQIWIGVEDKLPRAMRVVYRQDPSRLRHQVEFSNWDLTPAIAADAFSPAHLKKAAPIPFARPEPKVPSKTPSPSGASQ